MHSNGHCSNCGIAHIPMRVPIRHISRYMAHIHRRFVPPKIGNLLSPKGICTQCEVVLFYFFV